MEAVLKQISKNVYYLPAEPIRNRPILGAICGQNKTLLVDSGNSSAHAGLFIKQLKKSLLPPIEFLVLTHGHWDHVLGIHEMNLPTFAHCKTKEQIERMMALEWTVDALDERLKAGLENPFSVEKFKKEYRNELNITWALPNIFFEAKIQIDLGGVTCFIENIGGDHSEDSSIIFVEEEKILFLGDSLGPGTHGKSWRYTHGKLLALINKIESYKADIFVESHRRPMDKKSFKRKTEELRMFAYASEEAKEDKEKFIHILRNELGRELRNHEMTMVDYFINSSQESSLLE